jgi:Arc/MetJ family transcription regulator
MKRTNLVLDDKLLEDVKRELGARTYSDAVNQALAETLRVRKVLGLRDFFGSGIWQGDLAEMCEGSPRRVRGGKAASAARR